MSSHVIVVLVAALPVFLIVLLGVYLRRSKIIGGEIDRGLTNLLLNVLLPCFILVNIVGSKAASDLPNVLMLATIGAGIVMVSLALVYVISPLLGMSVGEGRRSFAVGAGLQNYSFMAVPLLMSLFADKELLATLFLHNLGVELAVYTVVVMILTGNVTFNPKVLLKGPVVAVFLGVLINVIHCAELIPEPIYISVEWLGSTAVPMSLLVVGMSIGGVLPETRFTLKGSFSAVLMRLIVLPAFIIAVAYLLPVEMGVKKVLLVQAAMPAALFPIVLAKHYGGKPALIAEVSITTSIVSFLTMPLIIVLGSLALGF